MAGLYFPWALGKTVPFGAQGQAEVSVLRALAFAMADVKAALPEEAAGPHRAAAGAEAPEAAPPDGVEPVAAELYRAVSADQELSRVLLPCHPKAVENYSC